MIIKIIWKASSSLINCHASIWIWIIFYQGSQQLSIFTIDSEYLILKLWSSLNNCRNQDNFHSTRAKMINFVEKNIRTQIISLGQSQLASWIKLKYFSVIWETTQILLSWMFMMTFITDFRQSTDCPQQFLSFHTIFLWSFSDIYDHRGKGRQKC